jgi:hypothetical protein
VYKPLKQGTYGPATQEQIAEAQAGQLVPILEAKETAKFARERKAEALVLLGGGLRNRKTLARAICSPPMCLDGAPRAQETEQLRSK